MIRRRLALLWVVAAVIISSMLTFSIGTAYLDNRIERGIRGSEIIDTRVDSAFRGLCELLFISARPRPKPPTPEENNLPDPESPYGKALAKYNRELSKQQVEGLAAVNKAIETYHCRR